MNFGSKFVYDSGESSDEEIYADFSNESGDDGDDGAVSCTTYEEVTEKRSNDKGSFTGFFKRMLPSFKKEKPPTNQDVLQSSSKSEKHSNVQKVRKATTNIISIRFETIVQPSHMHTGDPIYCEKCKVILTKKSLVVKNSISGDNDSQLKWICEFCSTENKQALEIEEIPDSLDITYMLQPAPTTKGMSVNNCQDNSMVIFCVDISGSMGITFPVNGKIKFKGYNDKEARNLIHFNDTGESQMLQSESQNTTYVSRLQSVQAAIENQLIEMEKEHPNRRVAIVTFESEVTMIADDPNDTVIINNDKLNDNKILFTIGQEFKTPKSIKENRKGLIDCLYNLEYKGTTALGPGLLASIGLASKVTGSKVILCTDGEANLGVGRLDSGKNSHEFYLHAIKTANEFGVNVSVITIKDTKCKLSEIGRVASETGGQVNIVDPLKLTQEFGNILADPVIATKVKATLFLHSGLHFCDEGDKNESKVEKIIGNVTKDTEITFQYGVRHDTNINKKNKVSDDVKNDNSATSNTSDVSNLSKIPEEMSVSLNKMDTNEKPHETTTEKNEPTTTKTCEDSKETPTTKEVCELPFQLQIEYYDLEGAKALRVITESKPMTKDRKVAEKEMKWGVITSNLAQKTHRLIEQGDLDGGRMNNISSHRLMKRNELGNTKKYSRAEALSSEAASNLKCIKSKLSYCGSSNPSAVQVRSISSGKKYSREEVYDVMSDEQAQFAYKSKKFTARGISDDEDDDDDNLNVVGKKNDKDEMDKKNKKDKK